MLSTKYLIKKLNKKIKKKIIHIDGDSFRLIFNDLGYSAKDRIKNSERVCKLVNFLNKSGKFLISTLIKPNSLIRALTCSKISETQKIKEGDVKISALLPDSEEDFGIFRRLITNQNVVFTCNSIYLFPLI